MRFDRRRFLKTMVGAGLALGLGGVSLRSQTLDRSLIMAAGEGNLLRMPPAFTGDTLRAAVVDQEIWPGVVEPTWTLGGSYPAPTIRVRRGQEFSVRLYNDLDEPTIVHWHGLIVPHDVDGHPRDVIAPGETYDYSFTVDQRAGTYWYHPHPHKRTGFQVYMGMAGFFIVEDDQEDALGLPWGDREVLLMVQDRRTGGSPGLRYDPIVSDHHGGFLGDEILVNGTPDAFMEVATGAYRLRLLNGSNARLLNIGFEDDRSFQVIGSDGGLLDKPYIVTSVTLAPGERVDVIVDFAEDAVGSSVMLQSLDFGGGTGVPPPQGALMPIMRIDVVGTVSNSFVVPTVLSAVEAVDVSRVEAYRSFEFRTIHAADGAGHSINNLEYDMAAVPEVVPFGEYEIWTFANRSAILHPIHIHGTQFRAIERAGGKLAPSETGWKDTVLLLPFGVVRVLVRFDRYRGLFLLHCHNLEHEDYGMMMNFEVADVLTGVESRVNSQVQWMDLL